VTKHKDLQARLELIRNVISGTGRGIAPASPASAYIPTKAQFRAGVESRDIDPKDVIRTMIDPIFERWVTLVGQGLAGLDRIEDHAASMSTSPVKPIPGMLIKYGDLPYKLRLNARTDASGGKVRARDIVEASGAALTRLIRRVTDTAAHAADAVIALRRFDDVVIRVLAAREASRRSGRSVAEVLALHREEGNLCVFPSTDSLVLGVPSAAPEDSDLGFEGTLIFIGDRPDMTNLVWLADATKATAGALGAPVERFALATAFFVQPLGGDVIGGKFRAGTRPDSIIDAFAEWSAGNWVRGGQADGGDMAARRAEARGRWATLESHLTVTRTRGFSGSEPEAIQITPDDQVEVLAGVLTEAVLFLYDQRRVESLLGPTPKTFDENFWGVRYNFMDDPTHPAGLLLSALLNVADSSVDSALRDEIYKDTPLANGLRAALEHARHELAVRIDPTAKGAEFVQAAEAAQAGFKDWMLADDNLELVEIYVEQAPVDKSRDMLAKWTGYQGLRSYGWHLRRMKDFYSRVFPGE
jgi:hypothetical protein